MFLPVSSGMANLLHLTFSVGAGNKISGAEAAVCATVIIYNTRNLICCVVRALAQRLTRCLAPGAPAVNIDGYERHFDWDSSYPHWVSEGQEAGRRQYGRHPGGSERKLQVDGGLRYYWAKLGRQSVWDTAA